MTDPNERTFLQEGPVKITDRRTIIGTITYPMSGITSANVTRRTKSHKSLWSIIAGIPCILWSLIDQTGHYMEFFNIGIVLIIVGTVVLITARPTYAVQIGTAAGDQSILRATDPTLIQRIVDAINHAIAHKG